MELQENEGELFQRKSQWSEGFAAFMEFKSRVVGFFTLWKNNIQTVEGKHGKQPFFSPLVNTKRCSNNLLLVSLLYTVSSGCNITQVPCAIHLL